MTLISVIIGKKGINLDTTKLLCSSYYLYKYFYFQQKSIKELCHFIARNTFFRIDNNDLKYYYHKNFYFLTIIVNNVCICAILDNDEYQINSLRRLLKDILDQFISLNTIEIKNSYKDFCLDFPEKFKHLVNYQNPEYYDKILKINKSLNETKVIMLQNIEKVLERGEKIDDLVKRSHDLSKTSKEFYKTSKKLNKCCFLF